MKNNVGDLAAINQKLADKQMCELFLPSYMKIFKLVYVYKCSMIILKLDYPKVL